MTPDNEKKFWTTEYSIITAQFATLLGLYIKVFVIYVGILGLAIKFALDQNSTPVLKDALSIFSILMCVLLFIAIFVAEKYIHLFKKRRGDVLSHLKVNTNSEFSIGHWASLLMFFFNIVVLLGWIKILRGQL